MNEGRPTTGHRNSKIGRHIPQIPAGGGPTGQDPDPATHTTEQAITVPGTNRGQHQREPPRLNVHTLKQKPL